MAHFGQSDDYRRDELIRIIEHSVEKLTLAEFLPCKRAELEREANKDWLEAKAKEEGVKALPKGIYYKVLSEGNQDSPKPTVRSIITAHYTGKTIDGKQSGHPWWLYTYL